MSKQMPPDRELSAKGMRIAIVAARWNPEIVDQLLQGAQKALAARNAADVSVYRCPGAFELAPLAARVARKGGIDGIVALGCLIRGGTDHYRVPSDALGGVLAHFEEADEATGRFADELVRGVQSEKPQIDALIQTSSTHWKLDRMARVDRNILRLAVYEILRRADVPIRVTLNEAIELGKKFGSEESSAFVNGVLDRIAHMDLPNATPKLDDKR